MSLGKLVGYFYIVCIFFSVVVLGVVAKLSGYSIFKLI